MLSRVQVYALRRVSQLDLHAFPGFGVRSMSNDPSIPTKARALEQKIYHAVMEFAPWPMAEVEGAKHVIRAMNPAFCALLKKSHEELLGRPMDELFAEEHTTRVLLDQVLRSGEAASHIETARNTPGPIYWSYTCWPLHADDGLHVGLMIQVTETSALQQQAVDINEALLISSVQQHELTDTAERLNLQLREEIAERQKAEQAVRSVDERLRSALDAAELGTWILDMATNRFNVDERYKEILGSVGSELSLTQGIDTVHPDDRDRVSREVGDAMQCGVNASIELEYRVVHPDGSVHWVLSKGRMAFDREGSTPTLVGFAGTVADITERKHLQLVLEQIAKDLAEVDRRKSEFLATLAHELRNPLAPLRNGLELLSMADQDGATWDQARSMMKRQLDQMVRLIDDLMDLSRISRGTVDLRLERVDLRTVLDQAVEACKPLIERQDHTLVVDIPDEPVMIEGDSMRLIQVFSNLLNNSAKYTDNRGAIAVHLDLSANEACVTVDDDGIGIAADQLSKVFDMFAQVERTNDRVQGGLGIGLNIVKHLVGMHGGSIKVHSDGLGMGSRFTVRLPLSTEQEKKPTTTDAAKAVKGIAPQRILIVDDNVDAASMMALLLGKMGHELRIANNGEEALTVGAELLPDVVLMDLGMPIMDGFTACRLMRKTPWGAKTLIVALSGWGQDEDKAKSKEAGFDHHLVKPITSATLVALIASPNSSRTAL